MHPVRDVNVTAPLIAAGFGMPMGAFAPAPAPGLLGATVGAL